jgi:hypothetical protein
MKKRLVVWLSGEKEKKAGWEPAFLLGSNAQLTAIHTATCTNEKSTL